MILEEEINYNNLSRNYNNITSLKHYVILRAPENNKPEHALEARWSADAESAEPPSARQNLNGWFTGADLPSALIGSKQQIGHTLSTQIGRLRDLMDARNVQ